MTEAARPPNPISERIATARAAAGYRQHAFAVKLGVHDSQVSRWEHGLTPRIDALRAIATLTDCSIDWLVTGEGREPSQSEPSAA